MTGTVGAHNGLHSERGARKGEHPGRSRNPVIKVDDLAWLEFQKPDLVRAEAFAHAFGLTTVLRSDDELQLRGTDAGAPCVLVRRGPRSRFVGLAFHAADEADLRRLSKATGASIRALPATIGGTTVDLVDPSGIPVRVVAGTHQFEALPAQTPHTFNFDTSCGAPTPCSACPASPRGCNGSDTWYCRRRRICKRWTGIWITWD